MQHLRLNKLHAGQIFFDRLKQQNRSPSEVAHDYPHIKSNRFKNFSIYFKNPLLG
jgi:hypothetical protein